MSARRRWGFYMKVVDGKNIFEIDLDNNDKAYMVAQENEKESVVIVDSDRFLELWKKDDAFRYLSYGSKESWEKDKKYSYTDSCFFDKLSNPVPLADVSVVRLTDRVPVYVKYFFFFFKQLVGYKEIGKDVLRISDGMTRTIWLLSKGAKCFPVLINNSKERARLKELAECCNMESIRMLQKETKNTSDN